MIIRDEPCGRCSACKTGAKCFFILTLAPEDAKALTKVSRVVSPTAGDRYIDLKPNRAAQPDRLAPDEPTITAKCPSCGDEMRVLAFIANTLKLRGIALPPCEYCRGAAPERADPR